jgi:hypothetical protein
MDCVAPPLQAKPAKGYSWMCSPCNRARLLNIPPPAVNSSAGRPKGSKNRDINLNRVDYVKPDANFRGWNFRYFGYVESPFLSSVADAHRPYHHRQYTVAEDTLGKQRHGATFRVEPNSAILSADPDDPIFPRNLTRIGSRYQAVVPTWEEQQALEVERAKDVRGSADRMSTRSATQELD